VRLDDDPLQHTLVEAGREDRVQQRPRFSTAERLDLKLREAGERLDRLTRREDHRDVLGQKAARHEREHARRCTVEPLRVVDHTEERLLLGGLRQQAEDREPDEERIGRPSRAQPERDLEGVALRIGQALHQVETRRAQLLERGERELYLPLDADRARDPEVRSRPDRIVEQRGLADARLAVHRQHAALPVARRLEHAVEHVALALPSEQLHRGCPGDHAESMPPGSRTTDFRDAIARAGGHDACLTAARKGDRLTTAIIGVGNIGSPLARYLVDGGESVVLAAKDKSGAEGLADELGPGARAASVEDAIAGADVVVFAVWLDTIKELIAKDAGLLEDKVVVDPSNPLGFDENGQMLRTLPEGQSSGSVVAALLPAGAHYAKAFGTLAAEGLASSANREPRRAVLFYATDDDTAATTVERLIRAAGFEPLRAGGVGDAGRIEMPGGDLHQAGLNGAILDLDEGRAAIAKGAPA
jgi:8-hydroxy-5-deazaflavin:NADPH oxidoreductase